jgi:nucleoside-diphosphate-sugar epimerase
MKHVLITGARGFFGHALVSHFLENTDWILICPTRYPKNPDRLVELGPSDRILQEFDGPLDIIIHAAANPSTLDCIEHPVEAVDSNIGETLKMLELARKHPLEHFIFISSTGVYGSDMNGHEGVNCRATNMYAATKLAGEQMCWAYMNSYGVPCTVARLSDVFGPRSQPERFPTKAIRNLLKNEKFTLHGENGIIGRRNWCSSFDAADMILFILKSVAPGETFNVSGMESLTHLEFLQIIAKAMDVPFEYNIKEEGIIGRVLSQIVPPTKLYDIGWRPAIPFVKHVKNFTKWTIANKNWC